MQASRKYIRRHKPSIGDRFGLWTVIASVVGRHCLCRCTCGVEKNIEFYSLIKNRSSGCSSCWQRKLPYDDNKHPRRLRDMVMNAIRRCTNQNHASYEYYGGRGIKVHIEWIDNPLLFVEYLTTLDGYDDESLWIDRIDNDSNYEPGNIRFVTPKESHINSRLRHGNNGRWVGTTNNGS